MNHQPLTEKQTLDQLWYFATNNIATDAAVIASACHLLTGNGGDDVATHARWPETLMPAARQKYDCYVLIGCGERMSAPRKLLAQRIILLASRREGKPS